MSGTGILFAGTAEGTLIGIDSYRKERSYENYKCFFGAITCLTISNNHSFIAVGSAEKMIKILSVDIDSFRESDHYRAHDGKVYMISLFNRRNNIVGFLRK
jgi:hypothetical protein